MHILLYFTVSTALLTSADSTAVSQSLLSEGSVHYDWLTVHLFTLCYFLIIAATVLPSRGQLTATTHLTSPSRRKLL